MDNSPKNKNYYLYPLWMLLMVIGITLAMSYIPSFYIFSAESKKVDILSDIKAENPNLAAVSGIDSMMFVTESAMIDSLNPNFCPGDSVSGGSEESNNINITDSAIKTTSDSLVSKAVEAKIKTIIESKEQIKNAVKESATIELEDFTTDKSSLNNFKNALKSSSTKKVRIAFIGDSFIEGDILSGDIREFLQNEYGGNGVGFVPATSISAKYRTSIQHSFANWTSYTIQKKNSTNIDNKFILSSSVNTPKGDSSSLYYKVARHKNNLIGSKKASFYFINEENTTITVVMNDSITKTFTPPSSDLIQEINIFDGDKEIKSLRLKFKSTQGFYAYGVIINSENGICVDNFSGRGSSGVPLLKISEKQTAAFRAYADYNLIVLQFGLNVLSKGKKDYSYFENKMVDLVNNMKIFYPNASIIIMGISDRSVKIENKYTSMPEIHSLRNHQRNIAKRTSVMYWDTYNAMNEVGGIQKFVDNKWAAKDHVHVNMAGARVIAEQFMKSLKSVVKNQETQTASNESQLIPKTTVKTVSNQ